MTTPLAGTRRFVLVLGFLTGMAAVSIDLSLPAIPQMVEALATSMSTGQLVVGLFMAGIALGQLPAGLLSDRIGRMPVLLTGVGLFTIAGLVASAANNIEVLLIARLFQGLAASSGVVVSRAIVRDIASGASAARMLSVMVMIFTAAPMLAPVFGAYLVAAGGWRWPFVAITVFGALIFLSVKTVLHETHTPVREHHILRHLWISITEFFSHRRSILGVLLSALPTAGFLALITTSPALVIEIYGYPVEYFGYLFALAGASILAGSALNRRLLQRLTTIQALGVGATLIGVAALQMLLIAWLNEAGFWWLWGNVCLFMFASAFLLPNATALALDPVPGIAGVAASIIGTVQSLSGSASSIVSSLAYDGTIRNIVLNMGIFGTLTALVYMSRGLILKPTDDS